MAKLAGRPHYELYVDESFFRFWGLSDPDGNFCYVVYGLPISQLTSLAVHHARLLKKFQDLVVAKLGEPIPLELKSSLFRRLPFNDRRRLALAMRHTLKTTNSFIVGEFQEVRGFLLESIRSDVVQAGGTALPQNWQELYDIRRNQLANTVAHGAAGQSPILSKLISLPTIAATNYIARRASSFSITLDPRGGIEDERLEDAIRTYTITVLEKIQQEGADKFKSVRHDLASEAVPGLQIADILAGEVRNWFLANREFLDFNSGKPLVTSATANIGHLMQIKDRVVSKPERHAHLPPGLVRRMYRTAENSTLPFFRQLLAKGLLSCVARWGEYRHIDFERRIIIDSPD
jgi:hypothetical protein